jgi:hypothetical protein
LTARSTLADVACAVAEALAAARLRAVLTGGACAHLYTRGRHASADLDFILETAATAADLDATLAVAGFARSGNHYAHPRAPYIVEFPAGPLAIGGDLAIRPVALRVGSGRVLALSPTDSCRDRLAAFYHWGDRQGLRSAVGIARRHRVDMRRIRAWSAKDGFVARFEEFLGEVRAARRRTLRRNAPGGA